MPLKSEQRQQQQQQHQQQQQQQLTKSKKSRHHSSNVFPDGFKVKDTVKRRIMGRLRAVSHSSASTNDRNTKTLDKTLSQVDHVGKVDKETKAIKNVPNNTKGSQVSFFLINC